MLKKRLFTEFLAVLFLISTLTSVIFSPNTSAISGSSCDEAFYSSNDILFYNPCATTCEAGPGGAGLVSAVRGKNNGEKIFNFWVDAGLTPQQAAGVTGSMQHEGGFSPFRQEMSQSWPAGGWGIAQFTFGQRDAAVAFVKTSVGEATFNQYYKNEFSGPVLESNGFIPDGVPPEINDKFLLGELNYLLDHVKQLKPNSTRRDGLKSDFNQDVSATTTLYDHLKTITQPGNAAVAWTYLYEYPADIKATSTERAVSADELFKRVSGGTATASCGGNLIAGGMTLDQAKKFMEDYKRGGDSEKYIGGAAKDCPGGPLSNCVSFSTYFVNKYTSIQGMGDGTSPGHGSMVAGNIIARNSTIQNGKAPRPYAIFSVASGDEMCDKVKCGHTGVILGVDIERGKVIVGEASCGGAQNLDTAREYELSTFNNGSYTYVYTEGLLKGSMQ